MGSFCRSVSGRRCSFLFGTTYGGDGIMTFGLPDLRGRASMGFNQTYPIGQAGGEPLHTLTVTETPRHSHFWKATTSGPSTNIPTGNVLSSVPIYNTASNQQTMVFGEVALAGGGRVTRIVAPIWR